MATLVQPTAVGAAGKTSIILLWVPVIAAAHLFAAFWLVKTWLLKSPLGKKQPARTPSRAKAASMKVAGGAERVAGDDVAGADQVAIQVRLPVLCEKGGLSEGLGYEGHRRLEHVFVRRRATCTRDGAGCGRRPGSQASQGPGRARRAGRPASPQDGRRPAAQGPRGGSTGTHERW
jgi:hypothetical protein